MIDAANVDIIIIKEIEIHITYKNILNSHFCRDATAIKQGIETAKDIKIPRSQTMLFHQYQSHKVWL